MWGERKLTHYLKQHCHLSMNTLVKKMVDTAYAFYGTTPLEDDITFIACQVTEPFPKAAKRKRGDSLDVRSVPVSRKVQKNKQTQPVIKKVKKGSE